MSHSNEFIAIIMFLLVVILEFIKSKIQNNSISFIQVIIKSYIISGLIFEFNGLIWHKKKKKKKTIVYLIIIGMFIICRIIRPLPRKGETNYDRNIF